jgi:proliferating cell nuclear antigen
MTLLFKAKTNDSHVIKVLIELLQNNIQVGCFIISGEGIRFKMMNSDKCILFDINLKSENFEVYKFRHTNKLMVGINLNHFFKMIRTIKKKDSIQLSIYDDKKNDLNIKVIPKENNRVTTSVIKIQSIQNMSITLPTGYKQSVIMPSNDYQKMCKSMSNISDIITITSNSNYICYKCDTGELMTREVEFGTFNDSDSDNSDDESKNIIVQEFDMNRLLNTSKISGLSNKVHVYTQQNLPIMYKMNVGSLGKMCVYIKERDSS